MLRRACTRSTSPQRSPASAGALLGRARTGSRSRWPFVLAAFVFVAGGLDVLHAILPEHRTSLLERLAPGAVHPAASALAAPVGVVLMLLGRGLARRKRRAWQIAVVVVLASTALHIFHGVVAAAVANGLLAVALVARRQDFTAHGDPSTRPRVGVRAALFLAGIYAYGAAALWVNRLMADRPYTLPFSFSETSRALAGLSLVQAHRHLSGDFAVWFPASILILELVAVVTVLASWLAPWRYRLRQETDERTLARALVSAHGDDTLAPFALRADKSYFFGEDERAFLAYRVVGGVAIVSGDPIGPEGELPRLLARFVEFAHDRDWRIAILGASDRCLPLYRSLGLQALYHGDEAVVDTTTFSLEGRTIRKVRQSVHRLERAGYSVRVATPGELSDELRDELEAVARAWRGAAPERGFAMALDALFRLDGDDAVFVIGRRAGRPRRGLPPLRGDARRRRALALDDAAAAHDAERLHRVARLRRNRVGARERIRARVAELRAVRRAARSRRRRCRRGSGCSAMRCAG